MTAEVGFHKIKSGEEHTLTKADAEHFFRLDDYVSGQARSAKIDRFRIIAAGHPELGSKPNKVVERRIA
jgi:hypothetical protein